LSVFVKTRPFGEIEVDEKQIMNFHEGILGFDYVKKFILLNNEDEKSPLKWLQAFDEPDLAFVIIRPIDFLAEYELVISQSDIDDVKAKNADELLVFAIVTIPANPAEMTANLQGPIIINPNKGLGKQAISHSEKYKIRHKILDEMKKAGKEG